MEAFFVLLGLVALSSVILGPIGFVQSLGLRRRLGELEQALARAELRLKALDGAPAPTDDALRARLWEAEAPPAAPQAAPEPQAPPEPQAAPAPKAAPEPTPWSRPAEPAAPALPGAAPVAPNWASRDWTSQAPAAASSPEPATPRRSFEEAFGARWTVWIGGLALALGALLLVRYSIEQGFFGPRFRVVAGLLLGFGLVVAGEVMRRRGSSAAPSAVEASEEARSVPAAPARPDIPAMLTAVGTVAAFGAIYAAHALYGFVGPAVAFVLLGIVGVACMFASALHGPALAGLGLVGALATPVLVEAQPDSTPWPVLVFVAVVVACAYALARLRGWLWLAGSAATGAALWGLMLVSLIESERATLFFQASALHALLHLALALYVFAWAPWRSTSEDEAVPQTLAFVAPTVFVGLSIIALFVGMVAGQYGSGWIAAAAATVALTAGAGALVAPAAPLLAIAAFAGLAVLRLWPAGTSAAETWTRGGFALTFDEWPHPLDPTTYGGFALFVAVVIAALGAWRLAMSRALPYPTLAIYAASATLAPLAALVVVFVRITDRGVSLPFAAVAAALALAFTLAAAKFRDLDARETTAGLRLALGAFASAALAALALGLVFALDGGMLTVALALAALGAAFVAVALDLAALRWCVVGLGLAVAARLAWEPRIVSDLGTTPVFNWLLFGYGIPAAAFGYAARLMRRNGGEDLPVRVGQALSILLSAFLVFFEIRHYVNGGDLFRPATRLVEQGLLATSALAFAIVLTRLDAARASPVFRWASLAAGVIAAVTAIGGVCVFANPYVTHDPVDGGAFVNGLLLAYALPAALAVALSWLAAGVRPAWYVTGAKIAAIALTFSWLTLQTRRLFHPDGAIGFMRATGQGEWYAYSAVWLGFGVVLLAWGLWRGSREARLASALFVAISVLKVFLFDMNGLEGPLRALSFIGLGVVLIGIGLVYQKLVFATPRAAPGGAEGGAPPSAA